MGSKSNQRHCEHILVNIKKLQNTSAGIPTELSKQLHNPFLCRFIVTLTTKRIRLMTIRANQILGRTPSHTLPHTFGVSGSNLRKKGYKYTQISSLSN